MRYATLLVGLLGVAFLGTPAQACVSCEDYCYSVKHGAHFCRKTPNGCTVIGECVNWWQDPIVVVTITAWVSDDPIDPSPSSAATTGTMAEIRQALSDRYGVPPSVLHLKSGSFDVMVGPGAVEQALRLGGDAVSYGLTPDAAGNLTLRVCGHETVDEDVDVLAVAPSAVGTITMVPHAMFGQNVVVVLHLTSYSIEEFGVVAEAIQADFWTDFDRGREAPIFDFAFATAPSACE